MDVAQGIEDAVERANHVSLAAEDWAKTYRRQPKLLAKLIKFESKFERLLRGYFQSLENERLDKYINWAAYMRKVQAADFDVLVDVSEIDDLEYDELLQIIHDPLQLSLALGAMNAEELYNIDLGINQYNESVMKAANGYTADLVKQVTQSTKDRIRQSINQSIRLKEDLEQATRRLHDVIGDPRRAGTIARTETVRSFSKGVSLFGELSNATGKQWEISSGPCAICASNDIGEIPFGDNFPSGDSEPPGHPNCRCSMTLVHDYS